jgi:hypothetical protein
VSALDGDRGLVTALAALNADELDVADLLSHLVADLAAATGAGAVAILATGDGPRMALLASTSHRASELEMLQAQHSTGPCVDAITTGTPISCSGATHLVDRWGEVGSAILSAGFEAVHAYPMAWHGEALGGLNVFLTDGTAPPPADLARAYADVATLAIVQSVAISHEQVRARLYEALQARDLVEQAKGVLAQTESLDMERAYTLLLDVAQQSSSSLTQVARDVISQRGLARP